MSTKILLVKPTDPELEENPRLTQVLEYISVLLLQIQ